jgi:hypothetical protein
MISGGYIPPSVIYRPPDPVPLPFSRFDNSSKESGTGRETAGAKVPLGGKTAETEQYREDTASSG